ncbi:MAG: T9SS type A sorting domain-containing protein [bacterium]|nr:T9SS type A sorting domain-containing protein [bacterium]
MTNPRSPTAGQPIVHQGGYDWESEVYNHITVNGDYLYTNNPATGTWHWPTDSWLSDFHLDQGYFLGNEALYAVASPGLEIRDLAVPEDPPLVGTLLTDHEVHNLVSVGDHAYAQCEGSLVVLDVGNPLSPLVIEEMPMPDSGTSAAVSTESLLLAGDDGLFAYDLRPQGPGHPVQMGSLPGIPFDDVELSGGVAYLVVRDQGMLIVDVSDLANLEVIGRFDVPYLSQISLVGNCLAATTIQSYFILIALDCSDSVPVVVQDFTAAWQGAGFRLAWRLARDTAGLRLDAHAGGRTWTVPWTREADGYAALDLDGPLLPGESVTYLLSARDDDGVWQELSRTTAIVPELTTALLAPHPNPFNPTTTLAFTLERPQDVRLTIHDLAGREVRRLVDVRLPAGRHTSPWDGRDRAGQALPAGTYLARLQAGDRVETRKLSLVK